MAWLNSAQRREAAKEIPPVRIRKETDGWAVYRLPFRTAVLEDFPTALRIGLGIGDRLRREARRRAFLYAPER